MSPTNALANADDDTDTSVEFPADCADELDAICDEQLAIVIAELESAKPW